MNGEFKYEKEIRLDEERIARYFDNISLFIDLPGENEAIFERISKVGSEKFRKCGSLDRLRQMSPGWDFMSEDDDEEDYHSDSVFSHSEGFDMQDMLDGLSVYYSELYALNDEPELAEKYLAILCQCGKTLGRVSDLLFVPDDDTDMRNALAKRSLRDINDLADMMIKLDSAQLQHELDVLQMIRKKVLDILFENEKE